MYDYFHPPGVYCNKKMPICTRVSVDGGVVMTRCTNLSFIAVITSQALVEDGLILNATSFVLFRDYHNTWKGVVPLTKLFYLSLESKLSCLTMYFRG